MIDTIKNLFVSRVESDGTKCEFYQDARDKWRWRRVAKNGRIIGASSQGYVNKSACIENARLHGCNE